MSEKVLQAAGDLNFWCKRAEQAEAFARTLQTQRDVAEADAAALREALIYRHTCENCGGGRGYYWTDVNGEAESEVCDCWIRAEHAIYHEEHPDAALLAELEAACEIVEALRAHWHCGGEVWRSIDRDFEAYDAAVKARTR